MIGKRKIWKRIIIGVFAAFLVIFSIAVIILSTQQSRVVQNVVDAFNEDFRGSVVVGKSDISPFANFPYVSVVLEKVTIFEDKGGLSLPVVDIEEFYVGFNLSSIISGNYKANLLKMKNGSFNIVHYSDGNNNLMNALSGGSETEEVSEAFNLELEKIEIIDVHLSNYEEESRVQAFTFIEKAISRFKSSETSLMISLNSQSVVSIIDDGDSTFLKNKYLGVDATLDFDKESGVLTMQPSVIELRNGIFRFDGTVDLLNDVDADLRLSGNYPNFNFLIGFAPEELIPVLEQYDNAGRIFFDASIRGKSANGQNPKIDATFGCDSAFFSNPIFNKTLEQIAFKGYFTNGEARDLSTMEFALENVSAKPESGDFLANLKVRNFISPEIDMNVTSDFDLDFLAKFLNVTSLEELGGNVSLSMNFKDIIDLQNPGRGLEDFTRSYYTELDVTDLSFKIPDFPVRFDSIDIKATMDGGHAGIEFVFMNIGTSDITIKGDIDDFPAIIHQNADTIRASLFVFSSHLDIKELTSQKDKNAGLIDEAINNLRLELGFSTTPRALFESPNLPMGDFYIRNFYGKLEHYPHTLKKFNAHVIIGAEDLEILEFSGKIDQSDFNYSGVLYDYPILLQDTLMGALELDFNLKSDLLNLNDLFAYGGENYVPEDYRNEVITGLVMYGNAELDFEDSLKSTVIYFDQLSASARVHEMDIRDIHGKIQFRDEFIILNQISGYIGNTSLTADMNLYLGENDSIRKANNRVALQSEMVDFDQLSNYTVTESEDSINTVNPDSVFNIYKLPFTDLKFTLDIDKFQYHQHLLEKVNADIRIQKNHLLIVDTLQFYASGGFFDISGSFDGSNSDSIFFYPIISVDHVDMNLMLNIFDNFGQDFIEADNIVGQLSGTMRGRLNVHANMVPLMEESEAVLNIEITDGELRNYKPLNALSEYFVDKNLAKIRFNTLSNQFYLSQGTIDIPNMTINSSLGFMEISGTQDLENNMEYYFRIPLKVVTRAARQKLFRKKNAEVDSTQIDAIQVKNENKKTWYVNLKLVGDADDYEISMEKRKKKD